MDDSTSHMNGIMLALSEAGARIFRMQSGLFFAGKPEYRENGVFIRHARKVTVGFPGIMDIIGYVPVTITADMVGQKFARYIELDAKLNTGRGTSEQKDRVPVIQAAGGLSGFAWSKEEALRIIKK